MKIAVLYTELTANNSSFEELSILQDAEQVRTVLIELGYGSILIPFCLNDLSRTTVLLREYQPDLVFNLVDEVDGVHELSHLPTSYLTALRFKYTGCSGISLALTTDKVLAKEILLKNGLPTPPWLSYQNISSEPVSSEKFIVKHRYLDGSAGLDETKLQLYADGKELRELLLADPDLMAEVYVDGREFAVPVFNYHGEILMPGAAETIFKDFPADKLKVVGALAKWEPASFEYQNTIAEFNFSENDQPLIDQLKQISRKCWDALHLSSYARVDFRVDQNNRPWILEVNGNPSIAANDWVACVAELASIAYPELIRSIVEVAK